MLEKKSLLGKVTNCSRLKPNSPERMAILYYLKKQYENNYIELMRKNRVPKEIIVI